MIYDKVSRNVNKSKIDNLRDIAGYAGCVQRIWDQNGETYGDNGNGNGNRKSEFALRPGVDIKTSPRTSDST